MILFSVALCHAQAVNPQAELSGQAAEIPAQTYPLIVPDDYPTIQAAIDAADKGDTVLVRPGTYVENIDFGGKAITVKSKLGPYYTVIDGNQSGSVVTFESSEGNDSILQGFTLTNGSGSQDPSGHLIGGGIRCSDSSPTILGNVIEGNQAAYGGGIAAYGTYVAIENNVIRENFATNGGGGIVFKDCIAGGPRVINNVIYGNITDQWGGGIFAWTNSRVSVENATITLNTAFLDGGGIACNNTSAVIIKNSIIWGDNAASEIYIEPGPGASPTITFSDVEGGYPGTGNIDEDPLFVHGPYGDFYLSQIAAGQLVDSPCVNTGDGPIVEGTTRTDGEPDSGTIDMGYHYLSWHGMKSVPAGEFEMGDHAVAGDPDELPVHTVYTDEFLIDVYEVTNLRYCEFLESAYDQGQIQVIGGVVYKANDTEPYCNTATSSAYSRIEWDGNRFSVLAGNEDHPMVEVSWYGALAFANWQSQEHGLPACYDLDTWTCTFGKGGYRLPTEAEWEKAARGGEFNPYYKYPWGHLIDGSNANYLNSGDPFENETVPTTPVGFYDGNQTPPGVDMANGYGLYDMAGNVWEWCHDRYDAAYYSQRPYYNPNGPPSGSTRVLRSGSWKDRTSNLRCANRDYANPADRYFTFGFRLVLENSEPSGMALIPVGEFDMGDHYGVGEPDELPIHAVFIDEFWMDIYEVTNQRYCDYLNSAYNQDQVDVIGGVVYKANDTEVYCNTTTSVVYSRIEWDGNKFSVTTGKEYHPMENVSWYGAVAYANWRSAQCGLPPCYDLNTWVCTFDAGGYRLPTEAEWEKAARGGEYDPYYQYPWGNSIDGSQANYTQSGDPYEVSRPETTPVGFYNGKLHYKVDFGWPGNQTSFQTSDGKNGWSLYDTAGNVWEWCNDWYDSAYYSSSPHDNPHGPVSGVHRVHRGGSWYSEALNCRSTNRDWNDPGNCYYHVGFRLAFSPLPSDS